jgi:cytochrome c oxidase cbb3-type subunit III
MTRRAAPLLFALLVFGFMLRDGHAQESEAVRGIQRYMEYCAGCHGADAKGGDKGPALISAGSPLNASDAELFRIVRDGTKGGMPSFAQIGDANIRAVVQVLRTLESNTSAKPAAKEVVTGDADLGRELYFGKAQCFQCHLMQGKGGFIANSLTNYGRNRAADDIVKAITSPDNPLVPSSQVVTVTTSTGQELTGVLRNEDNFNLELQSEDGQYHFLARSDLKSVRYTGHSLMPRDYATRLSPKELNDIASFLIVSSRNPRTDNVER